MLLSLYIITFMNLVAMEPYNVTKTKFFRMVDSWVVSVGKARQL